jgi:hypothetical protein
MRLHRLRGEQPSRPVLSDSVRDPDRAGARRAGRARSVPRGLELRAAQWSVRDRTDHVLAGDGVSHRRGALRDRHQSHPALLPGSCPSATPYVVMSSSVAGLINLINGWILGVVLGLAATLTGAVSARHPLLCLWAQSAPSSGSAAFIGVGGPGDYFGSRPAFPRKRPRGSRP